MTLEYIETLKIELAKAGLTEEQIKLATDPLVSFLLKYEDNKEELNES